MKAIDFTQPGGFPLTQTQLDYLQSSYKECLTSLCRTGSSTGAPVIINGMVSSAGTGVTNVSDGWFFYNNEPVRFPAQSYTAPLPGNAVYVVITPSASSLTYNDGSTPSVILDSTGVLTELVNTTPTDATHFLLGDMLPFGVEFGKNNREQTWNSIVVSTSPSVGGVTGTIYYKKDFTANTLHIRGSLGANNAQNFSASPLAIYSLMGTLPVGYIPVNSVYFISNYYVATLIKDDLGVGWVKQINCVVNTAGQIVVNWLKPDPSIAAYGIEFNTILPLD